VRGCCPKQQLSLATRAFTDLSDYFIDSSSEMDLFQLCNIRLIGRFSGDPNSTDSKNSISRMVIHA
jgi:hypothetical protein